MVYLHDTLDTYRLSVPSLQDFLTRTFGPYEFFIRVVNGMYQFWVPRRLTAVMHSFLDFVYPFGKQDYTRDFYFSGLREESRLSAKRRGLEIPELSRSGKEIRLCYNLRSVEKSIGGVGLPWSIRQSALYHSFDLETGKSLWINVKGNKLIKNRVFEAKGLSSFTKIESLSEAFSSSLATHLLICDWSGENWRWYINDLEDQLQDLTRNALAVQVNEPSQVSTPMPFPMSPGVRRGSFPPPLRTATGQSSRSPRSPSDPFSSIFPSRTTTLIDFPGAPVVAQDSCCNQNKLANAGAEQSQIQKQSLGSLYGAFKGISGHKLRFWKQNPSQDMSSGAISNEETKCVTPHPDQRLTPPELPPTLSNDIDHNPGDDFTFSDLQRIQYIEEKAQEALLVLRLNVEVLEELRQHYVYATQHTDFPQEIKSNCQTELSRFDKCVLGVKKDLLMLQSRTDTLLHLLANRNNLLNSILQYRSVRANEFFAKEAQISANHMETMTIDMHDIAQKTKKETVSMRVITSVTLFFLPSTFIATFMSTDILRFSNGTQNFELRGLKIYLELALPITALTFLAWFIIFRFAKKASLPTRGGSTDFEHSNAV
ncbi:hypothetical protein K505DRAFT_243993 [Melanomma pulvis-pyrius CBS 109.77]|uniref:CorA-like transporter domain-containing protein n=1 Tax=Melanomma pulvis-pyrius CBS 109.77 TaxID=1314802 RepID=A0A6A6XC85_9PLEO|nr:hypothetical protein K505DRAFT_243993 [Melanomma pulvis-pyrius CBS 109.77]